MKKNINGILCDLDGVITQTVELHAKAWKQLFDGYLSKRVERGWDDFKAGRPGVKTDLAMGICVA